MKGAIDKAQEIAIKEGAFMPNQFDNPANPAIHRRTTAHEIIRDFPDGLDYLITGVGTGGHITGCAQGLKERFPNVKVFAVEPETSPVISGGEPGPHSIQGIGAGFIPGVLDTGGSTQALDVAVYVDYAYLAERNNGIAILDVSDPANPVSVGQMDTDGEAKDVAVAGNYAYVADNGFGLAVIRLWEEP